MLITVDKADGGDGEVSAFGVNLEMVSVCGFGMMLESGLLTFASGFEGGKAVLMGDLV